jgi:acyl-CoA thioesterase-1
MSPRGIRMGRTRVFITGWLLAATAVGLVACNRQRPAQEATWSAPADAPAGSGRTIKIVALGDSLTAGYGLPPEQAYPRLLEGLLRAGGYDVSVANAGVSGDTTAGGLSRIDWALDRDVRVLIVALGANDSLRGLPVAELRQNLSAILERAQARGVRVVLAGMEAPPNLGPVYTAAFRRVYRDLADQYRVELLPFLLAGVAGVAGLNQGDGIHPNAEGTVRVTDNLWPFVERAVRAAVAP